MKKGLKAVFLKLFALKIVFYKKILSTAKPVGSATCLQPCLFLGSGRIELSATCVFGYQPSPFFYSGYIHLEARHPNSMIKIGARTAINNNASLISDGASIEIGEDCLIGCNFFAVDSDFHGIAPDQRAYPSPPQSVVVGNNCFIGNNVTLLKGVSIGANSTIAAGSVVTKSFPANVVIGGNPAKLLKTLDETGLKQDSAEALEKPLSFS